MANKSYKHIISREEYGHLDSCQFVGTQGPTCNCEQESDADIAKSMSMMGWKASNFEEIRDCSYSRTFGEHVVIIDRVMDGWKIHWYKGPYFTFFEKSGFGTIRHLMSWVWGSQAERLDETMVTAWEWAAMRNQLVKAGIKPREFGKK